MLQDRRCINYVSQVKDISKTINSSIIKLIFRTELRDNFNTSLFIDNTVEWYGNSFFFHHH